MSHHGDLVALAAEPLCAVGVDVVAHEARNPAAAAADMKPWPSEREAEARAGAGESRAEGLGGGLTQVACAVQAAVRRLLVEEAHGGAACAQDSANLDVQLAGENVNARACSRGSTGIPAAAAATDRITQAGPRMDAVAGGAACEPHSTAKPAVGRLTCFTRQQGAIPPPLPAAAAAPPSACLPSTTSSQYPDPASSFRAFRNCFTAHEWQQIHAAGPAWEHLHTQFYR